MTGRFLEYPISLLYLKKF